MSDVTKTGLSDTLAVLPLRDIVVFPHMIVPLFVGREKSVRAGGIFECGQNPGLAFVQPGAAAFAGSTRRAVARRLGRLHRL